MERHLRPVTIADAARRLGLARSTVACWATRGWVDQHGDKQNLSPVDYEGPRSAARYWLKDIEEAEFQIGLNKRRSHRRSERWQQIQTDRVKQFAPDLASA